MSNYTPISIIKYFPFQLFGTELSEITSMNNPIPLAIRKLMQQIEQNGQYFSLLPFDGGDTEFTFQPDFFVSS